MRVYDPLSERSDKRVRDVVTSPPHEIPLWQRELAVSRIAQLHTDELRREVQTEWATAREHIEHGLRFEGRAFYAPFFRTPSAVAKAGLWHHLDTSAIIMLSE